MFAIEVLTPRSALGEFLKPDAELGHALALAKAFEISREAAIRRYVALQSECLAVVFSKDGRVRYVEKGENFPATTMWNGDVLGDLLPRRPAGTLTTLDEAIVLRWLRWPDGVTLFVQTLYQAEGFAVTLCWSRNGTERLTLKLRRPGPETKVARSTSVDTLIGQGNFRDTGTAFPCSCAQEIFRQASENAPVLTSRSGVPQSPFTPPSDMPLTSRFWTSR